MSWSFRAVRLAGIDIRIHVTVVLVVMLAAFGWEGAPSVEASLFRLALLVGLFTCITLHELGHAVVARRLGVAVREIVLLPFGGVAVLGRLPERPLYELLVAIAGPLVNVVLLVPCSMSLVGLAATGPDENALKAIMFGPPSLQSFALWMFASNLAVILFNLVPAFPLDGGRILRALLAMRMGFPRATRAATIVGQLFAVAFGLVGILRFDPFLVLIAFFVFVGAARENVEVQVRSAMSGCLVGDFYNRHALTLKAGDALSHAVEYLLTSYQPDFAVLFGAQLLGVVTRSEIIEALSNAPEGEDPPVTQVMQREVLRLDARATLEQSRQAMLEAGTRIAAVTAEGEYLGLISREDIAEALAVLRVTRRAGRDALGKTIGAAPTP